MEPAHDVRYALAAYALMAASLLATAGQAQPSVRIRAASEIELDTLRDGALHGRLRDDVGEPLADKIVLIEVAAPGDPAAPRRSAARTDADGEFSASMSVANTAWTVRASFSGDREHAAAEQTRAFDRTRADVQLRFVEPRSAYLDLERQTQEILVRASSSLGGAGLALSLRDERGRALASGTTGDDGAWRLVLSADRLGAAGAGTLEARTDGDALRAGTRVTMPVVRFRHTTLGLSAGTSRDGVTLHGTLRAGSQALSGEVIGFFDGQEHVATVLSDRAGAFHYLLPPASDGRTRTWHLQARFASDAAWFGSSRSGVISVQVEPPTIPSARWLLLPALLLGLVAVWLLRPGTAERGADARPLPVGIHAVPRRSIGPAARRDVGGNVRDARTGRSIADVEITLTSAVERLSVQPEPDGSFRTAELAPGAWRLAVSALGYGEVASELAIPHRGQWADVQVRLPNLRDAVFEAYRPVALNRLPSPELWGRWTAREVLASALRSGRSSTGLERITNLVERVAYGRATPRSHDMEEVERARDAALEPFGDHALAKTDTTSRAPD
jgi:nitrogen fixation protein FixH